MTEQQTKPPAAALGMKLSPMNPDYQKDPFTLLDDVREEARIIRDDILGRYIVGRFEDVQQILNDRDLAVDPRKAAEGTFNQMFRQRAGQEEDRGGTQSLLFLDPPDH